MEPIRERINSHVDNFLGLLDDESVRLLRDAAAVISTLSAAGSVLHGVLSDYPPSVLLDRSETVWAMERWEKALDRWESAVDSGSFHGSGVHSGPCQTAGQFDAGKCDRCSYVDTLEKVCSRGMALLLRVPCSCVESPDGSVLEWCDVCHTYNEWEKLNQNHV